MNRQEFLATLKAELSFLPLDERVNALKYYEEYFEDAGEENEMAILLELGQPKQVADKILEDLGYKKNGVFKMPEGNIELKLIDSIESLEDDPILRKGYEFGAKTQTGGAASNSDENISRSENQNSGNTKESIKKEHTEYSDTTNKTEPEEKNFGETPQEAPRATKLRSDPAAAFITIMLLIFGAPLWIPLLSVVFVTIASIFIAFFSIAVTFLGIAVAGAAVAVAGVGLIFYSAATIFTSLFVAASTAGVGFLCLGGGIILGYVSFRLSIVLFKAMFKVTAKALRGLGKMLCGMFRRRNYNAA